MKQGVLSPAVPKGSDNMILNKFEDADILDSLRQIMELHTKHYKEDFGLDVKIIQRMAASENPEDRRLVWLSRPNGTHCLRERDVYLQDSHENKVFCFYHDQTKDPVLAYALTLKDRTGPTVTGNIYQLDYHTEVERVKLLTCPIHRAALTFADGAEFTVPYETYRGYVNELSVKHGELKAIGYEPESEAELSAILSRQRYRRSFQASKGDIEKHIGDLKKTSVRGKLQEAKETVAPPSEKHVRKGEPSL